MGLRSLEDGYVPPILDVSQLDRKLLVSNEEAAAGVRTLLEHEAIFAGLSAGAAVQVATRLARELEEFGLLQPRSAGGEKLYGELDVEIAAACGELARFGLDPRHLRTFRSAAERQAGLLEAIVAPALRARNPERRRSGLESLAALGAQTQELTQLLLLRAVRKLAS
jgi:hypothetical protein